MADGAMPHQPLTASKPGRSSFSMLMQCSILIKVHRQPLIPQVAYDDFRGRAWVQHGLDGLRDTRPLKLLRPKHQAAMHLPAMQ